MEVFLEIAELQKKIMNAHEMSDSEIDCFREELLNSPFLNNKNTFRSVIISLYIGYLSRAFHHQRYLDLFVSVAKHPKSSFTSDDYVRYMTHNFFRFQLYKLGIISIKSLYEDSRNNLNALIFFYPEIKQNYPNEPIFGKIDKLGNKSSTFDDNFFKNRENGINPDPVCIIIKNDNVEHLQIYLSQTNRNILQPLCHSIFESVRFVNVEKEMPTMIEYAAFFGSVKVFKFLLLYIKQKYSDINNLLNSSFLKVNIAKYAVAGGNYEIIHICENMHCDFKHALSVADQFFRYEINSYLEESIGIQKDIESVSKSIIFYNLKRLIDCDDILSANPNTFDDSGFTPLSIACLNGDLDIVQYFVNRYHDLIDVNICNKAGNRPLHYAAQNNHLDVVSYLSKLPSIDLNARNSNDLTALHVAIEKGFFEIVKYMCQLKNLDYNLGTTKTKTTPLEFALKGGFVCIAEYLLLLPGTKLEYPRCLYYSILSNNLEMIKFVMSKIENFLNIEELVKDQVFKNMKEIASEEVAAYLNSMIYVKA